MSTPACRFGARCAPDADRARAGRRHATQAYARQGAARARRAGLGVPVPAGVTGGSATTALSPVTAEAPV
jgi:hypothetical protein